MPDHIRLVQLRQTPDPAPREPGVIPPDPGSASLSPDGTPPQGPPPALPEPGVHPPVRSLYLHVPFCAHKCHYCDFYSIVDPRDRQEAFTDRLIDELDVLAPHAAGAPLRTIFVGGGTPSMLRLDLWERLLGAIDRLFDLSLLRTPHDRRPEDAEWTVECNPESTTPELLGVLRAGGVDRVSFGAQSFNPRHLKTLERLHEPGRVASAVEMARACGIQRRSVDLIFGIPGQTIDEWREDLRRALELGLDHLSAYALTYEPNTAMTARRDAGAFTPADEDDEAEMYELAIATLEDAGLARYEVSNFARPGQSSRHNLAYWRQEQWLAAGPSASGHLLAGADESAGSVRYRNAPHLGAYLDSGGRAPVIEHEGPDPARLVREILMMGLRLREGVDASVVTGLAERASPGAGEALGVAVSRLTDDAMVKTDGARWSPTARGLLFANSVCSTLMACVPSR